MIKLALLFVNLILNFSSGFENRLPCALKWVETSTGDFPPTTAIAAHTSKIYVARAHLHDREKRTLLGYYNRDDNEAVFFYKTSDSSCKPIIVRDITTFEVLDNPNSCEVQWSISPTELDVRVDPDVATFVARAPTESDSWYPGELKNNASIEIIVDNQVETFTNYQTLRSATGGLHLAMDEFIFDDLGSGNAVQAMNSISVEHFRNDANAQITQSVSHSRKITETFQFPISSDFKVSKYTAGSSKSVGFPSFLGSKTTVKVEQSFTEGVEVEKIEIKETILTINKTIIIPPNSWITVCSTIDVRDQVEASYTARGVYSANGVTSRSLFETLRGEGLEVRLTDQNIVETPVRGMFKGSVAFATTFQAIDGLGEGCY